MNLLTYTSEPLYLADDVKLIERKACEQAGFDLFELMQRAGLSAWQYLTQNMPTAKVIKVVAGAGNNAGDGFILAIHAYKAGKQVEVLTVKQEPVYHGDAASAYQLLCDSGVTIKPFSAAKLAEADVVVDAILGTGLTGALRPHYLEVIDAINDWRLNTNGVVYSLDIPSGLAADTGTVDPRAIESDFCLSFINLKPGMVTAKAREYCANWSVAELDVGPESRVDFPIVAYTDDATALIHSLPKRKPSSHKGNHGHLILIGGDDGYGGAILMAAQAAAKVGVGRFTIITRDSHVAPFLTQFPEAMVRSIDDPESTEFESLLLLANAIVIGPGLGLSSWGKGLLEACLGATCPVIIDADGLNHLAANKTQNDNWILTPHPGEAARLLACETSEIEADRYQAIRTIQANYMGTVVLKGAGTLVTDGSGITVCTDGNPGMATAGMGDILSGIVGSLLAQGIDPFSAARIAVALHAKAGDLAAEQGEKGLLATDLLTPLRQLVNLS